MDRRALAVLGRGGRPRREGRRRRDAPRARRRGPRAREPAARAQARGDPRQGRRRARPPARGGRPHDLRGGRQADEGGARRGGARDVDLHLRSGHGANARRRDGPDGRLAGRRGKARVHAPRADRRRRRDLAVQLPAQPRRAQDRAGARGRLPGRAEAGHADAALGAPARRAGGRGRPAAGLAERRRRACLRDRRRARRGRARAADHVHGLGRRRLGNPRARPSQEGQPRARQRDAGDRVLRRSAVDGGEARRELVLLRRVRAASPSSASTCWPTPGTTSSATSCRRSRR